MFRSFITIIYVLYCSQSICRFLLQYFKLFNDKETHFINQLNFEIKRLRFSHPFFPPTTVETLLECPQQSSKHQNKQKSIFLKSSQVSKVIKLPLSLPSEKNHVKMQVLKSVPPEHKQPKHRGLLPFPTDQICRQIQRKFAVTIIKQDTVLLTITAYLELKNTLSTLPSGSMDRAINLLHVAQQLELMASLVPGRLRCQDTSRR